MKVSYIMLYFYFIWLSNMLTRSVPDEGCSGKSSCTLNVISTFILEKLILTTYLFPILVLVYWKLIVRKNYVIISMRLFLVFLHFMNLKLAHWFIIRSTNKFKYVIVYFFIIALFDIESTRWRSFLKHVVRSTFDIHVFNFIIWKHILYI